MAELYIGRLDICYDELCAGVCWSVCYELTQITLGFTKVHVSITWQGLNVFMFFNAISTG